MTRHLKGFSTLSMLIALLWAGCSADDDSAGGGEDAQPRNGRTFCGGPVTNATGEQIDHRCSGWAGEWACACDSNGSEFPDPRTDGVDSDAQACQDALEDACAVDAEAFEQCSEQDGLGRCTPVVGQDGRVSDSQWACRCDGDATGAVVTSSSCEQALIDRCATSCSEAESSCRPTGQAGTYNCECDGSNESQQMYGPTCETALARACTTEFSCESRGDACAPTSERDMYECSCTSYYDATRDARADSCDEARERACSPIGGPCNGWSGFCDDGFDDNDDYGFFCSCNDGSGGFRTPEALGGTDDCTLALEDVCGIGMAPVNFQCTKDTETYGLVCTRAEQDGVEGYECSCNYTCENAAGGRGTFVEGDDCQAAIGQISCDAC